MNHAVIGLGEIGSALTRVLVDAKYKVSTADLYPDLILKDIDVLHICFPYSDKFVTDVKRYSAKYNPRLIIIYSTVQVGTTKQIKRAVHCPIEGKHPKLDQGIRSFKKFIGFNNLTDRDLAVEVWADISGYVTLPNTDWTEFLKLASTSKYGINIVWADYMADVAEQLDMPYKHVKEWDKAYNDLYRRMQLYDLRKYVLDPPDGFIGGHCVVPNAELLNKSYPDEMLEMIVGMGEDYDNL
jgi:UDP-N-acetyl-D-mannosaminuronate dehydrogenase